MNKKRTFTWGEATKPLDGPQMRSEIEGFLMNELENLGELPVDNEGNLWNIHVSVTLTKSGRKVGE